MRHKTRELLLKQRTMSVNALRSHLAEFGIIVAKGIGRLDALVALRLQRTFPAVKCSGRTFAASHAEISGLELFYLLGTPEYLTRFDAVTHLRG